MVAANQTKRSSSTRPAKGPEPVDPNDDLRTFLRHLWQPGDVREVRAPKHDGRRTASGYFDDPEKLARAVASWDGRANLYLTLNPVNSTLLARAANRINPNAVATTADADIVERRLLLVDVDPLRPSGISATYAESVEAVHAAHSVVSYLDGLGWARPIVAMSGNGAALLYAIRLPNDAASAALIVGVLGHLADRFDTDLVKIDRSVSNAARIGCLVGTMKMKGDATPDRPHRRSGLVSVPDVLVPVPVERLAALVPATNGQRSEPPSATGDRMPAGWVRERLDSAGIAYSEKQRGGFIWYRLGDCPFHPGEGPGDCAVGEAADGHAVGKCFHSRGAGRGWADFRDTLGLQPVPRATPNPDPREPPAIEPGSIGERTALDLRHGTPPPQLVEAFLTAEGATAIYGPGGVGKGLETCWLVRQLVRLGHVVMVVDYEGHEREWGSRLRGLGMSDEELARVHYRAPFASDWTAPTGALSTVADAIREDADRVGATYVVVDSYSVATSNGDTMGGEAAAREYFSGLARIGRPSLTIAHVRGDSARFPDRPFGSVFVHNLARETWAVEQIGDPPTDDGDPYGPVVIELELRNKKANSRPLSPPRFNTFSFFADGTIEVTTAPPAGRSVADLAAGVLAEGPMTLATIAKAIREDSGQAISENTIRTALKRHPRRFAEASSGRPRQWSKR